MTPSTRPSGMTAFIVVWIGQLVSLLGTAMTNFGVTIWAYQKTGRATELALLGVFFMVPLLVMSPIAGVFVDRYNRKLMMALSDLASGVVTIAILILFSLGRLEIWHLYICTFVSGTFQSFQWPAYSATISLMVSREQYTRANSMMSLTDSASGIFAPLLAGALLGFIGLHGILVIDIVTFVMAVSALLVVVVPEPVRTDDTPQGGGWSGLLRDATFGFHYILKRPPLLALQSVFMLGNFCLGMAFALFAPMILARSGSNELLFGTVQTIGAVGGVVGGVVVGAWGGFKRNIHGVLIGWAVSGVFVVVLGLGRIDPLWAAIPLWGTALFIGEAMIGLVNPSNQSIWQSKVSPELQGRVFSIRRLIAGGIEPLAAAIAGPLADRVMEPAMQPGGALAHTFGWLVGTGPGAGMGLIFVFAGFITVLIALGSYLVPIIRNVEAILPDFVAEPAPAVEGDAVATAPAEA